MPLTEKAAAFIRVPERTISQTAMDYLFIFNKILPVDTPYHEE